MNKFTLMLLIAKALNVEHEVGYEKGKSSDRRTTQDRLQNLLTHKEWAWDAIVRELYSVEPREGE